MSERSKTIELAQSLIRQPSVTPNDGDCQMMIAKHLESLGFQCHHHPQGNVKNLWATHGQGEPVLLFAGHTDVVPPGPLDAWTHPPFEATIENDTLFGRGSADMKGAIAAMCTAAAVFVKQCPDHPGTLAFLITSDEEGVAVDGTKHVIDILNKQQQALTWCIVGEASSERTCGDAIKVGRRGSLHATLTVQGQQGHIAYPDRCQNPIPVLAKAINAITAHRWDEGNEHFPPTTCQVSNVHAGDGADNVVPNTATALINWRFSPASTVESIQRTLSSLLEDCALPFDIAWRTSAEPFASTSQAFLDACDQAILTVTGKTPEHNTRGGTSDGRFIATTGCEVVEIGVRNHSIHQIDEHVTCQDLDTLHQIYIACMKNLLK